jgi:hypothetical protein
MWPRLKKRFDSFNSQSSWLRLWARIATHQISGAAQTGHPHPGAVCHEVMMARRLRQETTLSLKRIAERLWMGS